MALKIADAHGMRALVFVIEQKWLRDFRHFFVVVRFEFCTTPTQNKKTKKNNKNEEKSLWNEVCLWGVKK